LYFPCGLICYANIFEFQFFSLPDINFITSGCFGIFASSLTCYHNNLVFEYEPEMKIHFYLRFTTKQGQDLFISGNIPELGYQNKLTTQPVLMQYKNQDFWEISIELASLPPEPIAYYYQLRMEDGSMVLEWGNDRQMQVSSRHDDIQIFDTWNHAGEYENAFYTAPFQEILLPAPSRKSGRKTPKHVTHIFKIKAPLLHNNEAVCISGNGSAFKDWSMDDPLILKKEGNWWIIELNLSGVPLPVHYKYGVYDLKHTSLVQFENGPNRSLPGNVPEEVLTILQDGFIHLPNSTWKGAGVSIPVFSLRTKNSFGTGEFSDIRMLVDWARKTGLKLVQILPVNDTSATGTWIDSYPYGAISAFALHPLYLNLEEMAGKKNASFIKSLKKIQKQLNILPDLDYEIVMQIKTDTAKELFAAEKEEFLEDADFKHFFENNKSWLVAYAAFCYLKDSNNSADSRTWKTYGRYTKLAVDRLTAPQSKQYDQITFYYFIQYHLYRQLRKSVQYAHENGIILKGDIPIGVYRHSCDAWVSPELYHMDLQAGAPPDPFAVKGQNWGFPTYNWERMARDSFQWWKNRFSQMAIYFDAFRIDHILGFFRIWSIPLSQTEGIMGHFEHAIPVHRIEFDERNIYFDSDRYTKPFINEAVLWEYFGQDTEIIKGVYFEDVKQGRFKIREFVDTQRKVSDFFEHKTGDLEIKSREALMNLISNVILFEVEGSEGKQFHFRISMETTSSFRYLDWHLQNQLKELYINYFYRRQDAFWKKEAMKKLPLLKRSTNMLVCGEDLGMVPSCVPDVMKQTGILSLEIQRMPKDVSHEFFNPATAPYLSVVTPSTHDMSTIRGWWEEDRSKTQKFFNEELGQWGEAPSFCDAWINKAIVQQHLHAPAMWSIFQLQDLLGMDENIRRENPHDERINVPAIANYYWRYRIHIYLEDLVKAKPFNEQLREMVKSSGR
jgi:4-alpha-glucanotransferase